MLLERPDFLPPGAREQAARDALAWLQRSIAVHGGRGSAHSYSPLFGWKAAYPETTGYLIPTLFDAAESFPDLSGALRRDAFLCADWLLTVQLNSGAFPGLTGRSGKPSLFNTAQVLFGLIRAWQECREESPEKRNPLKMAVHRAVAWMLELEEPGGGWRKASYIRGFEPTYYTRAVWALLEAGHFLNEAACFRAARRALGHYAERIRPNHAIRDWGFQKDKPAFTHTIAYTLEGFFESALLLGETEVVRRIRLTAETLRQKVRLLSRTPGSFDDNWHADPSFLCLSGNVQLSAVFKRLAHHFQDPQLHTAARAFLLEALPFQNLRGQPNTHGALPGSTPFWGPYLRGRYPNWATKFLVDSLKN